tara:strand:+ start:1292 stop:2059 length:768 start_codon:yes stop_codon:yes gene_type:complete
MRELVNKYESAHGSDDTIIVSTLEPDTPKEDRGENNKVSKPFYVKIVDFFKKLIKNTIESEENKTRIISAFLLILILAIIMLVIIFFVLIIKYIVSTIRGNSLIKKQKTAEFKDIIAKAYKEGRYDVKPVVLEKMGIDIEPNPIVPIVPAPLPGAPKMIPEPAVGAARRALQTRAVKQRLKDIRLQRAKDIVFTKDLPKDIVSLLPNPTERVSRKYVDAMVSLANRGRKDFLIGANPDKKTLNFLAMNKYLESKN